MKLLVLALACACGLSAQSLTAYYTTDMVGRNPNQPLPSSYSFGATPVGNGSTILVSIKNTGSTAINVITVIASDTPGGLSEDPNYTIPDFGVDRSIAPGYAAAFTVNFTPTTTGTFVVYLQAFVQISNTQSTAVAISTLTGTGTAPQLYLTYNNNGVNTPLFPFASSRLDFGAVSTSSSSSIVFTLTNETTQTLQMPQISINAGTYTSSAFSLSPSSFPATLAGGASLTFTITFAPGQTTLTTAILQIGSNNYGIQGTGIAVTPTDALQIYYVDPTGVRTLPQAATPISFGQIVPGSASSTLNFTITNPQTSFNAITVPSITVTGSAYALSGLPALPTSIQPGGSISFSVSFNASNSGTYTGTLAIGSRTFSLTGLAVVSPVPSLSFHLSEAALSSGQQVTLTIQAATASSGDHLGTLTMTFTSAVANVTDDPAVVFTATSSRTLSVELLPGAQTATYQGQSGLTFQTGTTAGTLTLTLSFPNTQPLTQSYTITPAQMHVSTASATRQDPYLVVTINGFDNTYSAGKMSFTFYDLKGKAINSTPLAVDATTDFHNYFFTNNQAGGAFSMQAKFPVKGDIKQIGSVALTLDNSAGQTTQTLPFQ